MTENSLAAKFSTPAIRDILIRSAGVMTLTGEISVVGEKPMLVPLQTQEKSQFFG